MISPSDRISPAESAARLNVTHAFAGQMDQAVENDGGRGVACRETGNGRQNEGIKLEHWQLHGFAASLWYDLAPDRPLITGIRLRSAHRCHDSTVDRRTGNLEGRKNAHTRLPRFALHRLRSRERRLCHADGPSSRRAGARQSMQAATTTGTRNIIRTTSASMNRSNGAEQAGQAMTILPADEGGPEEGLQRGPFREPGVIVPTLQL